MGTARKRGPRPAAVPPDPTTPNLDPVVPKAAADDAAAKPKRPKPPVPKPNAAKAKPTAPVGDATKPRRPRKAAPKAAPATQLEGAAPSDPGSAQVTAGASAEVAPAGTEASGVEPEVRSAPTPESFHRVWVTGGAGFVGRSLVRTLIARGYDVTAAVRDPRRATFLTDLGATVVEDDLSDVRRMTDGLREMDAVIHAAGQYRVGITREERGAMWDANIGTTTRVLDAAEAAGTKRIVYVSTANVYGNTFGLSVD